MLPDIYNFPSVVEYISLQQSLITEKDPGAIKKICCRMIALIPDVKKEGDEYNAQMLKEKPEAIVYDFATAAPFKRLAILYEKEGNIHQAITVCHHALSFGFSDDGTKGGIQGRLDKLMKKVI